MPTPEQHFGLTRASIDKLRGVFSRQRGIVKVIIYGSRAMGTHAPASDIDLTIDGELTLPELLRIESEIDELLLPYTVDLSLYARITDADLRRHIEEMGKVFYSG